MPPQLERFQAHGLHLDFFRPSLSPAARSRTIPTAGLVFVRFPPTAAKFPRRSCLPFAHRSSHSSPTHGSLPPPAHAAFGAAPCPPLSTCMDSGGLGNRRTTPSQTDGQYFCCSSLRPPLFCTRRVAAGLPLRRAGKVFFLAALPMSPRP